MKNRHQINVQGDTLYLSFCNTMHKFHDILPQDFLIISTFHDSKTCRTIFLTRFFYYFPDFSVMLCSKNATPIFLMAVKSR